MEVLTTEDLEDGKRFVLETFYKVKYIVGKDGIITIDPFDKSGERRCEADSVEITLCLLGSWFQAILCRNGTEEPFLSNCITITSIKPV